jgi:hypothetical protein
MKLRSYCLFTLAVVAIAPGAPAALAGASDGARAVFDSHRNAVVRVEAVQKAMASADGMQLGQPQEQEVETLGTVIDPNGLVLVSNSQIDTIASIYDGRTVNIGGQQRKVTVKSEITELKVVLADGTEIPGRIVLTDADLDMAFVQMDLADEAFQGRTLACVDLARNGQAHLLDEVVMVAKLGKLLNYNPLVQLSRVASIVDKPRTYYVAEGIHLGCPAFLSSGELLGVGVIKHSAKKAQEARAARVILPAADIAMIARQAREAAKATREEARDQAESTDSADKADDASAGDRTDETTDE